jgi:Holliday junction resolvase RusA-like endonuclease
MKSYIITLPFPPSTNGLFSTGMRNGKLIRFTSPAYKEWQARAGNWLREQMKREKPSFTYPVHVRIIAGKPDNRARDIDNLNKPILDLLVKGGLLADDSSKYVQSVHTEWTTQHTGIEVAISKAVAA